MAAAGGGGGVGLRSWGKVGRPILHADLGSTIFFRLLVTMLLLVRRLIFTNIPFHFGFIWSGTVWCMVGALAVRNLSNRDEV